LKKREAEIHAAKEKGGLKNVNYTNFWYYFQLGEAMRYTKIQFEKHNIST
jgi:hypothetical protein